MTRDMMDPNFKPSPALEALLDVWDRVSDTKENSTRDVLKKIIQPAVPTIEAYRKRRAEAMNWMYTEAAREYLFGSDKPA